MKLLLTRVLALGLVCCATACSSGLAKESVGDPTWPVVMQHGTSKIVLYQLQPESLTGDRLTGRAAISITREGDPEPVFGAVWIEARIATDRDSRTVTLLDVQVPDVKFPEATSTEIEDLQAMVRAELPRQHPVFSLDELVATISPEVQADMAAEVRNDPPHIVFATHPTALITIDGPPQLREIEGSKMMRVVNTPFIILFDPTGKTYHLRAGTRWRKSATIDGHWEAEPNPPAEVVAAVPKSTVVDATSPSDDVGGAADLMVVTEPTELVTTTGEPLWTPLAGNDLLYLSNTESDVFLATATHAYYVLLAGRWYTSSKLEAGPWTFVASDALPEAFAHIPATSPKSDVRTFVAGTTEAREAVLDASIPQTAKVSRKDPKLSVIYDGEPRFETIPGTPLTYATNTTSSVIAYEGQYYCCSDGVWYSAASPSGPWSVCTDVPDPIYTIPPSSPVYPVRYVYVYESTPDYVYCGYLPGYTGCYVAGPTIVYGTGYWYPGWIGAVYYPHPWTWGFGVHYDPWSCGWSFGFGYAWGVNPWWFGQSCGFGHPGWWGPGGFHGNNFEIHGAIVRNIVHPTEPSGIVPAIQGRENLYQREVNRSRVVPVLPLAAHAARATAVPNNVFTDGAGRVMRRTDDGWEERQRQQWQRAQLPATTPRGTGPGAGRVPPAVPNGTASGRNAPVPGAQPRERQNPPQPLPPRERQTPLPPAPGRETPQPPREPSGPIPRETEAPLPPLREQPVPIPRQREAPLSPARMPDNPQVRSAPIPPRGSLRQAPSPARDDFDGMDSARQRGNARVGGSQARPSRPPH